MHTKHMEKCKNRMKIQPQQQKQFSNCQIYDITHIHDRRNTNSKSNKYKNYHAIFMGFIYFFFFVAQQMYKNSVRLQAHGVNEAEKPYPSTVFPLLN